MEGARRPKRDNADLNTREFVVSIWRRLGEPQVGDRELRRIKREIDKTLGDSSSVSPAAMARMLADEGAELRHPEIIEFDAHWRESQLQLELKNLKSLGAWSPQDYLGLAQAESLIGKLEKLRQRFDGAGDDHASKQIRTLAIEARRAAVSRIEGKSPDEAERAEQAEIAEWLRIWLQTPNLFAQWLELRKSSPDFSRIFSTKD